MDDNAIDQWAGPTGAPGSLERLCSVSLHACRLLNPLVSAVYEQLVSSNGHEVKKEKKDNSAFTIADGLVQRLLIDALFSHVQFRDIVGEEDDDHAEASDEGWRRVQGLAIPPELRPLVESSRDEIKSLALDHLSQGSHYNNLSVFIDPIDGTREFSTGKGEQCSICIGFANDEGKAVAGVVYRPLSQPQPTWVAGAKDEEYAAYDFGKVDEGTETARGMKARGGLLTTNGSISPFVESLIGELQFERVKSGGAGNKMMMLLESSICCNGIDGSMLYIQDRGVSRWDSCSAEACLESFGGKLTKLAHFVDTEEMQQNESNDCYTYLASQTNLDFIPGSATLTKYNSRASDDDQLDQKVFEADKVTPYSNLCGLVAFGREWNTVEGREHIQDAIQRAASKTPPSFD